MAQDRITSIRVRGMRTLADVELKLDGLTVLMGENGSGKSSIVEACEILRKAATAEPFMNSLIDVHGGWLRLATRGKQQLGFTVRIDGADGPLEYSIEIQRDDPFKVAVESLTGDGLTMMRAGQNVRFAPLYGFGYGMPSPASLLLRSLAAGPNGPIPHAARRVVSALEKIEAHLPFLVLGSWVGIPVPMRAPQPLVPIDRLSLVGNNVANVFYKLKVESTESEWRETMEFVRLGLGDDVETVIPKAEGGGSINLYVKLRRFPEPLSVLQISDGQLAYLAFVALFQVAKGKRSLVAFDEPELHLHPHLLGRVVDFFQIMARDFPIVLATHSNALLDCLEDPAKSAVLCELDEMGATKLHRPDPAALAKWLERYTGLGQLRSGGLESIVMKRG